MNRSFLAFALLVGSATQLHAQTLLHLADSTTIVVAAPRQEIMSSVPQSWRDSVAIGWANNFTGGSFRPATPLIRGKRAELSLQILRSGDLRRVRVVTSSGDRAFDSVLVATSWAADRALAFPKFTHQMEGAGIEISLSIWSASASRNAPAWSAVSTAALTLPAEIPALTPKCDTILREPTAYTAMTLRARLDSVNGDSARREWAARALTAMQPEFRPTRGFAPVRGKQLVFGASTDPRLNEVRIAALLRFVVDSTGHLTGAEMGTSSGYPGLDTALIAMVRTADSSGAIPPPPPGAASNSVEVLVNTDRGATHLGVPLGVVQLGDWIVDQIPVITRPGPMVFPEDLKRAGVGGRVTLQFLVGPTGDPVPRSVLIISSAHQALSAASERMIYGTKFRPGIARGCAVNVLVQQSVNYAP